MMIETNPIVLSWIHIPLALEMEHKGFSQSNDSGWTKKDDGCRC